MILYHGSNTDIQQVDLSVGLPYKDFGKGFYLTSDRQTASRMALKKTRLFGGTPTLITYELDEAAFTDTSLNVKRFPEKATADWFLFVDANRDRQLVHPVHNFDIVCGPIADDGVVLQISDYHRGKSSPEQAALELQDRYLDQQYFFGTEAALRFIHKISSETL